MVVGQARHGIGVVGLEAGGESGFQVVKTLVHALSIVVARAPCGITTDVLLITPQSKYHGRHYIQHAKAIQIARRCQLVASMYAKFACFPSLHGSRRASSC